jgi:hypothetical protein
LYGNATELLGFRMSQTCIFCQPQAKVNLALRAILRAGVENRIFVYTVKIFAKVRGGQKDELGAICPKLALWTAHDFREYFYPKVRFPAPGPKK